MATWWRPVDWPRSFVDWAPEMKRSCDSISPLVTFSRWFLDGIEHLVKNWSVWNDTDVFIAIASDLIGRCLCCEAKRVFESERSRLMRPPSVTNSNDPTLNWRRFQSVKVFIDVKECVCVIWFCCRWFDWFDVFRWSCRFDDEFALKICRRGAISSAAFETSRRRFGPQSTKR